MRGAVRPEETDRPHPGWISFFSGWVGPTEPVVCLKMNDLLLE